MSLRTPNLLEIKNLEKKAFDILPTFANKHGLSLISSIAFFILAISSSVISMPSTITFSILTMCVLSSALTIHFHKILQSKISSIIAEKNALNITNWDIKKAKIFSYYTIDFTYAI